MLPAVVPGALIPGTIASETESVKFALLVILFFALYVFAFCVVFTSLANKVWVGFVLMLLVPYVTASKRDLVGQNHK